MKLLERIRKHQKDYARDANPAEPHATQMAAMLNQTVEWMEKAQALLCEAQAYISHHIYSDAPYGPEAKALYEELCHFGADQPTPPDIRWRQGVEEAIKIIERRIGDLWWTKPDAVWALEGVETLLRAMLSRGSYENILKVQYTDEDHG